MQPVVIDPNLNPTLGNGPSPAAPEETDVSKRAARTTKNGRPSKAKSTVPGSAADFRRREANRLAADRSRSRQSEKAAALEHSVMAISEENARLKEQIAALESEDGRVDIHQEEVHDAEPQSTSGPSRDTDAQDNGQDEDIQTQEQQEAHSHTILAALTDITGVDFSEGNESNWMQGMETFLKENGESGRLGDLAAVATGHEDGDRPDSTQGTPFRISYPFNQYHSSSSGNDFGANALIILAAALNTEVERVLMEDLALTKAAVVKVERQIANLQQDAAIDETAELDAATVLPPGIFSDEAEALQAVMTDYQERISRLENELPPVRDEFVKERDEKSAEEKKIVDLIREIKSVEMENEEERGKMMTALRSAGGFVDNLLNEDHPDNQYMNGTFSSPALVRRRRGRPPKSELSRTFFQSFIVNNSSQESDLKGKGKTFKRPRRSKLPPQTPAEEGSSAEPSLPNAGPSARDGAEQTSEPRSLNGVDHEETDATAEAVTRAEAFILSHLNPPQSPPHGERDEVRLDSTSFADFLPAQEELERREGEISTEASGDAVLEEAQAESLQRVQDESTLDAESVSVLSRLRQGPPGSCDICMRTETTVWRKLVLGNTDHKVCNACGLYHAKFGVIRPPELWGDGKSLKKRRATPVLK